MKGELSSCQIERGKFSNPGNGFAPATKYRKKNFLILIFINSIYFIRQQSIPGLMPYILSWDSMINLYD